MIKYLPCPTTTNYLFCTKTKEQIKNKESVATELHCIPTRLTEDEALNNRSLEGLKKV